MTKEILKMVDSHAHVDLDDFSGDREDLFCRSRTGEFPEIAGKTLETGEKTFTVCAMVLPGITAESTEKGMALARNHDFLFPGVGIHPNYTQQADENDWRKIERLSEDPSVIAVGETGLDLHWDESPIALQIHYFTRHLFLAKRRNLPVIVHCREAEEDLMAVLHALRSWEAGGSPESLASLATGNGEFVPVFSEDDRALPPVRGVIHSFSDGPETASELIRLGFYLGFTGSVTFTSRKFAPIGEAAKILPADRFLLETDSPFLTPHPFRGKLERNEPLMATFTARRLAELRSTTTAEIIRQTAENAATLFGERVARCLR